MSQKVVGVAELVVFIEREVKKRNQNGGIASELDAGIWIQDLFTRWWQTTSKGKKCNHHAVSTKALELARNVRIENGEIIL